ncbi:G patch domain and ankyrin repeat-containing protein 1 homolog isoform X1 [Linepithema humile]|uniref:G patch domain and ankyrin repeat-containing protein 1 homolog isoform X1 n=1 Tax=Linepithema humile TaxID=83485 RepID=UPI00351E06BB
MSLQSWMHLRYNIDIPWKMFVRESPNIRDKSPEKHIHQLAFQGNDAKVAYEEIIQSCNSNVTTTRKYLKSRTVGDQSNSSINSISIEQSKKTTISEDVLAQVTINTLLKAVEQKDLKFLQKHMTSENVNVSDDFGWTPLMSAAYCGHLEIVRFLLNLGANKKTRDRSGLTAAQLALKKNYLSIVALLKKKSDSLSSNNQISTSSPKISNTNALSTRSMPTDSSIEQDKDICNVLEQKAQFEQNTVFYCEICKTTFQETTLQKHESSTLHIFNTKPKLKHAMYGISRQNKGYRMLLNTGWDEEAGLGPSGKGIKYPIKTCLKIDRKGLGQLENEYKVTHFKPGDATAINSIKIPKQKTLKKRDRERLLHREARKERALRIALS